MSDESDHDVLLEIRGDVKHLLEDSADHETRIRSLEGGFFKVMSIAGFIGFLSGWFGRLFGGGST